MFDRVLTATLSWEKVFITGVTQGNLELILPPNSLDSQKTQKQQDESQCDPTPSFIEGDLIHWIEKAKNVRLKVSQLSINIGNGNTVRRTLS